MQAKMNGKKIYPRAAYMVARTEDDYKRVQAFLRGTEFEGVNITYPTMMAFRKGKLVGVLGTYPSEQAVIAGPLLVRASKGETPWVTLRLAECYEAYLWTLGITQYVFTVSKKNKKQISILHRMGLEPYASTVKNNLWYMRYLDERS